jgi:peptidoglycan/xylan/chitin deacetylase (PgdA/CDA1 family)
MRKILIATGTLLALLLPAAAGPQPRQADVKVPVKTQLALFQQKTIFKSGLPRAHTIALTFDDGPNAHTAEVLDALREMNVKATFFIVGKQAHKNPKLLARIAAEGHLLANHSADHELLGTRYDAAPERLVAELRDVDQQIQPLMHRGDKLYFRAPYGAWKSAHADILNADPRLRNYVGPIYWDIGGDIAMRNGYVMSAADWDCWHIHWSAQTCAKGYLREVRRKDGGVVLMHCIHVNSAALVRAVVPALLEEGYTFVRLDQMPEYRQYETPGAENGIASAEERTRGLAHLARLDVK